MNIKKLASAASGVLFVAGCAGPPTIGECQSDYYGAARQTCLEGNIANRSRLTTGDPNYFFNHPGSDPLAESYAPTTLTPSSLSTYLENVKRADAVRNASTQRVLNEAFATALKMCMSFPQPIRIKMGDGPNCEKVRAEAADASRFSLRYGD